MRSIMLVQSREGPRVTFAVRLGDHSTCLDSFDKHVNRVSAHMVVSDEDLVQSSDVVCRVIIRVTGGAFCGSAVIQQSSAAHRRILLAHPHLRDFASHTTNTVHILARSKLQSLSLTCEMVLDLD